VMVPVRFSMLSLLTWNVPSMVTLLSAPARIEPSRNGDSSIPLHLLLSYYLHATGPYRACCGRANICSAPASGL
jgi:hypothetical protein